MGILTRNIREVVETFARTFGFQLPGRSTRARTARTSRRPTACWRSAPRSARAPRRRSPSATTSSTSSPGGAPAAGPCSCAPSRSRPKSTTTGARPNLVVASLRELLPLFDPGVGLSAAGPAPLPAAAAHPCRAASGCTVTWLWPTASSIRRPTVARDLDAVRARIENDVRGDDRRVVDDRPDVQVVNVAHPGGLLA